MLGPRVLARLRAMTNRYIASKGFLVVARVDGVVIGMVAPSAALAGTVHSRVSATR